MLESGETPNDQGGVRNNGGRWKLFLKKLPITLQKDKPSSSLYKASSFHLLVSTVVILRTVYCCVFFSECGS